ncbi:MAG: alpha/beta fold hydrolase [Myxococcales bacterium]
MTSFVWLHGFASGPGSSKGRFVRERLAERGVPLALPDLNEPAFRDLTVSRMLARVDRLAGDAPAVLLGSSLGGFVAATWAAANPTRCAALVLLAPAFDLSARWAARMGEGELARWERDSTYAFDHYGTGRKELLAHGFLEDARAHAAFPLPVAPTLVVQGDRDDVVSPELAREFARRMEAAGRPIRLALVPEGHELTGDLPGLWREIERHLAPLLPPPAGKP